MRLLSVGLSARAMAEVIAASHWKPGMLMSLDYFADLDLQSYVGKAYSLARDWGYEAFSAEGLQQAVGAIGFDALVYASGVEHYPDLLEDWAGQGRVLGNGPRTVSRARNWEYVHRVLAREGIAFPRTYYSFRGPTPQGCWLRKPRSSGGGAGIDFSQPGEHVPPGFLLQEHRTGKPASVSFVADGERGAVLGVTEQLCGWPAFAAPGFLYTGNVAPLTLETGQELSREVWDQVQRMVNALVSACHLRGWNGIDFLLSPREEVLFLELNPRFSGSMELFSSFRSWDLFRLHLEACRGKLPAPAALKPVGAGDGHFAGKGIVYAPQDLVIPGAGLPPWEGLRDIPPPETEIPQGEPLCTVLGRGRSREECMADLQNKRGRVLAFLEGGSGRGTSVGRS